MTRSTRSSSRNSSNKRKPFGTITPNKANVKIEKARGGKIPRKETKKKIKRRTSRQIGDDVIIYIQEKKSKSGKLYRAQVDEKTGGITFTPANRKTPIAYDRHRHLLIEKTPEGDELEIELDTNMDKENIEIHSSKSAKTARQRGKVKVDKKRVSKRNCNNASRKVVYDHMEESEFEDTSEKAVGTDDTEKDADDDFSQEDDDIKDDSNFKVGKNNTPCRKKQKLVTENKTRVNKTSQEESDDEEEILSPARRIKKKSREPASTFCSPIVKPDWEEQGDWRCSSAIDY